MDPGASIPPTGEETSFPLDGAAGDSSLLVRHGSSLSLMAGVCEFLSNPVQDDTFSYVDPTADHHKWARKGLNLYYACVVTSGASASGSSAGSDQKIICALRAATDLGDDRARSNGLFLIDYVYTDPMHRGNGVAGRLISTVLDMAKSRECTLGVLSIEESCVYWLEKWGFVLCDDKDLKALNVFSDTHLLIHRDCIGGIASRGKGAAMMCSELSTVVPPETFASALKELCIAGASLDGLHECLKTIAQLVRNAKSDTSEAGRRRTIRINNPKVHERVFSVGGEAAMKLLQVCGFELQANDNGDAVLTFLDGQGKMWLDAAIAQLEHEGDK